MAGSSSLEGHFGTGLRARFSSAWSNVGCGNKVITKCNFDYFYKYLLCFKVLSCFYYERHMGMPKNISE